MPVLVVFSALSVFVTTVAVRSLGAADIVVVAPSTTVTTGVTVTGSPDVSTLTHGSVAAGARASRTGVTSGGRAEAAPRSSDAAASSSGRVNIVSLSCSSYYEHTSSRVLRNPRWPNKGPIDFPETNDRSTNQQECQGRSLSQIRTRKGMS